MALQVGVFLVGHGPSGTKYCCIAYRLHGLRRCRPVGWFDSHNPCSTSGARVLPFRVVGAVSKTSWYFGVTAIVDHND